MSALRALRQVSGLSRLTTTRNARMFSMARIVVTSPASKAWAGQSVRAFSGTARAFGSGATDVALSQKVQAEIQYEKQANADLPETPEFVKALREQGVWTIEDVPGHDEITLNRKFGNETIRLIFSIADIQAEEEESDYENAEEGEGAEDEAIQAYPIRVSLSMTKSNGPGVLNVDMVCQEGHFMIDNTSYYTDANLGTELTAEADWKRRGLYIGPQFDTLDVGVQEEFEKFLQERGVNESLALFIPEYSEYKEQQEYIRWLNNVKAFIDL
ncbi:hypothetical protein AX15_006177 [Amanita polypyramis BW_CC]|nr:hypothetical protein AX15_006177 [Amanita polypyramis BW_CC]